ncbi:MAG: hypothetical protein WBP93_17060 [Pyrinomonadaceae bacterium]
MPTNKKSSRPKSNKTGSTNKQTKKKQPQKSEANPEIEQDTRAFGEEPIIVPGGARSRGEEPIIVPGG